MRADAAIADRMQAVREAARGWSRAGWIDESALRAIDDLYPDDRVRSGPAFRILFFALTLGAIAGALGIVSVQFRNQLAIAILLLGLGFVCAGVTEYLIGPQRRCHGGIEAAFSFAAIIGTLAGLLLLADKIGLPMDQRSLTPYMITFALVSGAAAWRWGYWPYAALAACFASVAFLMMPAGRLLWAAVVLAASRSLMAGCDSRRLPPSLRKSSAAVLTVCLLTAYAALNVFALDHRLNGWFFGFGSASADLLPRWLSIVLTAALPPVVVLIGIFERRRLLLSLGFLMAIFSLITLRFYFHIAPTWVVFTGAGLVMFASAAGLRRFLDSGAGGERGGFAAAPLAEDPARRRELEVVAGIATLTPGAATSEQKPEFRGGGGGFGGGGASGDF